MEPDDENKCIPYWIDITNSNSNMCSNKDYLDSKSIKEREELIGSKKRIEDMQLSEKEYEVFATQVFENKFEK